MYTFEKQESTSTELLEYFTRDVTKTIWKVDSDWIISP